ncbi:FadR/GntR family transcriptional regulator [Henriciella sp.]|uniref:FadR/GntR family transcriptional regulator n=1 Tax=Henriciella sp. TaxID=1968823 RepID=UPI00261236F2|nr:FadR/GntR family transcriptional regulator [Henriciella sp.]
MTEKRLYQTVARSILDMIESGSYPPGTRLPGERELAERFDVSRVVVREAEISLEALGRVEIKVGSGVYVRDPVAMTGLALPRVTPFELTQTRLLFESECAALAATMITDEQIAGLEATIERMKTAPHDTDDGEAADRDFHLQIAQATDNEANVFFLKTLWRMRTEIDPVKRVYSAVCHADTSHRVNEHSEVLEALRARDPGAARIAMRGHFSRLLEALLDASERQAIEDARRRSIENRERFLKSAIGA